jgi:hypothetical protein
MRLLNRPLALILAVALAGASVLLIVEVIAHALHVGPAIVPWHVWYRWAHRTRWDALVIKVWSVVLIVIGALVLAAELRPPRVTRLRLQSGDATDAAVTRSGLAGTLRGAATGVDGITGAAVTIRRGRARVTARSAARGRAAADTLREPVTGAVRDRLDSMDLRHPPRLTVRVITRSR